MAASINTAPLIQALRVVINTLPFSEEDRAELLEAVERRALVHHNAKELAAAHRRRALNPITPEQRLQGKLRKRAWRARRKKIADADAQATLAHCAALETRAREIAFDDGKVEKQ
jgi:hypothetical protein